MLIALLAIVTGLALLVWSADRFVDGASATARHFGMPALLIGMVIVGFGTSAPEMVVSALVATQGNPGIALGNAYGFAGDGGTDGCVVCDRVRVPGRRADQPGRGRYFTGLVCCLYGGVDRVRVWWLTGRAEERKRYLPFVGHSATGLAAGNVSYPRQITASPLLPYHFPPMVRASRTLGLRRGGPP